MATFPVKTKDGTLTLDTTARTVYMGGQGGSIDGGSAVVDSAGAVDKRITATRLVLTGPLALAWRKKKDERELYLLVEGASFSMVARVDPKEGANTRKFAAAINTSARGGQPVAASLGGQARNAAMASERKDRLAAMSPEQRAKYYKTQAIVWGTIILIVVILIIVGNSH
jgi:hypothetical protein